MSEWLTCIDVATDRGIFAVGRGDGLVIIADMGTGKPLRAERLHLDRVASVAFAGDVLWTAGFDGQVAGWDLYRGAVRRFDPGHGRVLALRTAPDLLLTVGDDGHARLWDRESGAALQTLDEQRFGPAYAIAASPEWVAIGYRTGDAAIWLAAPGERRWAYEGHLRPAGRGPLYAIAVAPARRLVACARDRMVALHEPGDWPEIDHLPIDLACNDLQFDAQGVRLIGACSDRQVRLWEWQPMVGSSHGHWSHLPWTLGAGIQPGEWEQACICSGARWVGEEQVISSWFDGTARLFTLPPARYQPERVARLGEDPPSGWME